MKYTGSMEESTIRNFVVNTPSSAYKVKAARAEVDTGGTLVLFNQDGHYIGAMRAGVWVSYYEEGTVEEA